MDGRCRDCTYWKPTYPMPMTAPDGSYVPMQGECQIITGGHPMAEIYDDANYHRDTLYTREDFGCVLFEAKE